MLEELLKCESLGSRDELSFLIFNALSVSDSQQLPDLKSYCTSNHFSIGKSLDGMLKLLMFMGLINISNHIVTINNDFTKSFKNTSVEDFEYDNFIEALLLALKNEKAVYEFITPDSIRRDFDNGYIFLRGNLIHPQFLGVRNLLISLGAFIRDPVLGTNKLIVSNKFIDFFEKEIMSSIKKQNQFRRKSLSSLKAKIENQEKAGKEAELFVLEFEKQRLAGHPSKDEIQRISEEYVDAGFDIESFHDKNSVFVDRFIEVKSFSKAVVFYWSQNEVEAAKELSENYFLYLVDRTRMLETDYTPKVFRNPYQSIFENDLWQKEPQSWKFSLQE